MKLSRIVPHFGLAFALAATLTACNDVGDNTGSNENSGNDAGLDSTALEGAAGDVGTPSETGTESGTDGGAALDGDATTTPTDSGEDVASSSPDGESDSGNVVESSSPETGVTDSSDGALVDSGTDTTVDGGVDATAEAAVEASTEAGAEAAVESGTEAGEDARAETGSGVVPCTTASQTNCVPCDGNTSNLCTPTEALVVNRDIAKGSVEDGGLRADSCYECLYNAGCIDDDVLGDSNHECGDLTGTVGSGGQASETQTQACLTTLGCIFGSGCQNAKAQNDGGTDGIDNCYCGSNFLTASTCNNYAGSGATPAPNGSCAQDELDGLGLASSVPGSVALLPFTTRSSGSGMANAIFLCAGSNSGTFKCPSCFE
jgi:hypothetical protein